MRKVPQEIENIYNEIKDLTPKIVIRTDLFDEESIQGILKAGLIKEIQQRLINSKRRNLIFKVLHSEEEKLMDLQVEEYRNTKSENLETGTVQEGVDIKKKAPIQAEEFIMYHKEVSDPNFCNFQDNFFYLQINSSWKPEIIKQMVKEMDSRHFGLVITADKVEELELFCLGQNKGLIQDYRVMLQADFNTLEEIERLKVLGPESVIMRGSNLSKTGPYILREMIHDI